mmetsp:Transcript_16978/g.32142  ORF Transcript_16978/g.32142 Transcript_16978/m.32142 type:complete len:120 (-) Transcript_16978:205-564(-)|eukprot:CAMPEP_0176489196 /NCGR_PEP_ID=MMETSP0200_2-20121128/7149_1 /TAXON_ID=947934 /ORGANISM="Chaetoceros sp., Strain GSL56" /LENGTH=119 /DNA_ID=CAMNT_0017886301 /DNA_START=82 /DNA_END=441 /DNA_ORIENTATION=-
MNSIMLAQLMKDLQDPEMMREAQKMMQDPAFQAHMKKITQSAQFQQSMKRTQEIMTDPEKVKEMQKTMETRLAEGQKQLQELEEKEKQEVGSAQAIEGKGEEVPVVDNDGDKKPSAEDN